jgi:hypothetical protein
MHQRRSGVDADRRIVSEQRVTRFKRRLRGTLQREEPDREARRYQNGGAHGGETDCKTRLGHRLLL